MGTYERDKETDDRVQQEAIAAVEEAHAKEMESIGYIWRDGRWVEAFNEPAPCQICGGNHWEGACPETAHSSTPKMM